MSNAPVPSTPAASTPAPKPNGWKTLPDPSEERLYAAGIAFNDHQFLVIGGYAGYNISAGRSCEYYDTTTEPWHSLPDLPYDFASGGVAKSGDRVFVVGGSDYENRDGLFSIHAPGGDLSSAVGGTWEPLAKMQQGRRGFACESDSKYIYVFGGEDYGGDRILDSAERYDIQADKWEPLPPMPGGARIFCAAGRIKDKIYIVGGQNENRTTLSSTIVFDTASGNWKSPNDDGDPAPANPVPDMNAARRMLAVVAVDPFVIAIGGDGSGGQLSSIEVLDTEANSWAYAPTPMTVGNSSHVAGFLKAEKVIIVVGGFAGNRKSAISINFEKGLKPRSTTRGQKILGDGPRGEDMLNLRIIAVAIANTLLFKDLKPPFVVGILGKWGRGKSFFFNMIEEHMIEIQKLPSDGNYKETYAGHIYVIDFSAWEFSKGDIWSSLMYKILKDLNMQLQFEDHFLQPNAPSSLELEKLGEKLRELSKQRKELKASTVLQKLKSFRKLQKVEKEFEKLYRDYERRRKLELERVNKRDLLIQGKISTVEMFRKLSDGELEYLRHNDDVWEAFQNIRKTGDQASETLIQAINMNYENDLAELKVLEANIKIQAIKDQRQHVVMLFSKVIGFFVRKYIDRVVKQSSETVSKYEKELKEGNIGNEELDEAKKKLDAIKSIDTLIADIPFFCQQPLIVTCVVVFTIAAIFFMLNLEKFPKVSELQSFPKIILQISLYIPAVTSLVTCMASTSRSIRDVTSEVLNGDRVQSNEMKEFLNQKNEISGRASAFKGRSLKEAMEEIDEEEYEKNLSIIHRVHTHLKLMSDSMTNKRRPDQFPRGPPRIVLFVDDLDRCDCKTVVKVLEAIQLLVSHELFTAIVAIDPRYVTNSIEMEYSGVLDKQTAPTGMDYLEKFIQIPFRLPDVGQDKLDAFIDFQMEEEVESDLQDVESDLQEVESAPQAPDKNQPNPQPTSQLAPQSAPQPTSPSGPQPITPPANPIAPADATNAQATNDSSEKRIEENAMPRIRIPFTKEEKNMMKRVLKPFGVEPRCTKRIINVFKLLKVIWEKDSNFDEEDKEAILFMMLLASDNTTRDVTFNVFDWMESGSVQFHRVMENDQGKLVEKNDLASVFRKELKKKDENNPYFLMQYIDEYLSKFSWTSLEEWNEVSRRFRLARCFSFFRLVPSATDTEDVDNNRK